MKLLLDMNLSPRWVPLLLNEGWETVHWSSVGSPTASDSEIMEFAAERDFVVLTYDLDFGAILATTHGEKPSVVQIRVNDISPQGVSATVVAVLRQLRSDLEAGALITINSRRTRVRLLPLKRGQE